MCGKTVVFAFILQSFSSESEEPHTHRSTDGRVYKDIVASSRENDCLSWKIVMTIVLHSGLLCTRRSPEM